MVHGGQNPIVGAHVYLYAIAGNGYGGASTSLLTSTGNTTKDVSDNNYYVTSDSNGNFSITGDYTCGSPSHYYLYAVGGDSGSGANSAATLMASLGSCTLPNFASQFINVNEVSTIATAYAFSGYAVSGTQISSPNTAAAGKAVNYASFTVTNLETLTTGVALATTRPAMAPCRRAKSIPLPTFSRRASTAMARRRPDRLALPSSPMHCRVEPQARNLAHSHGGNQHRR